MTKLSIFSFAGVLFIVLKPAFFPVFEPVESRFFLFRDFMAKKQKKNKNRGGGTCVEVGWRPLRCKKCVWRELIVWWRIVDGAHGGCVRECRGVCVRAREAKREKAKRKRRNQMKKRCKRGDAGVLGRSGSRVSPNQKKNQKKKGREGKEGAKTKRRRKSRQRPILCT